MNLSKLNPNQRQAVLHPEGPLLILAGAGSGKTSTMAYRIAHLIAVRHMPATAILGLSFTNKAAAELKERVKKLVTLSAGRAAAKGLTISTFHSLCVRILREHADRIGFQKDFTIVDTSDQKDILKSIMKNVRIDDRKFDLDTILFEIGQAKSKFLGDAAAQTYFLESKRLGPDYAIAAATCFTKYKDQLKLLNSMDFDDLLYNAVALLEKCDDVRAHYNARFRHLLVDEYQDTNAAQFKLLRLLTQRYQNICVVGDDDQSIYAWRGADPEHILGFAKQYVGARTITLDQNYRSTSTILDAANQVIRGNTKRFPKTLWSDRGVGEPIREVIVEQDRNEGDFVAEDILARIKAKPSPWKDFAILYRSNLQSRIFEEALRRNQIPYKIVGGMSFLDRKEVKDALSYWRVILNPKDDASLRRVINTPSRGIGKTTQEALGSVAFAANVPLFDALLEAPARGMRGAESAVGFREMILELRRGLENSPPTAEALSLWGKHSLEKIGLRRALEEFEEDPIQAAKKWENVEELVHSLGQMKFDEIAEAGPGGAAPGAGESAKNAVPLMHEFLARMALEAQAAEEDANDKEKQKDKDQVTLLTLHGAKGLEYPVVYLVGLEEGFLPHKRTIEEATDFSEERRLAYVGITRARDHLVLTRAKHRIRYGKPVPRTVSRFLEEIPRELLVRTDESLEPDHGSEQAREAHEVKVKDFLADIRARLQAK